MKTISGWFLCAFILGYFITDSCRNLNELNLQSIKDNRKLSKNINLKTAESNGFLRNWEIPEEKQQRVKVLESIGLSIPLDLFLTEWGATRKNLSIEEQALIINKVLPRLIFCRPEIGISRICSQIGSIPTDLLVTLSIPRNRGWLDALFESGPAKNLTTKSEQTLSDQLFSAFSQYHREEATAWARRNWTNGGRATVLSLFTSNYVTPPPIEMIAKFLNEDEEIRKKVVKANFGGINTPDGIEKCFNIIREVKDPEVQGILAGKIGMSPTSSDLDSIWRGIQTLPEGTVRESGNSAFLKMLTFNFPRRAMENLLQSSSSEESREAVSSQLIKRGYLSTETIPDFIELAKNSSQSGSNFGSKIIQTIFDSNASSLLALQFFNALPQGADKIQAEINLAQNFPRKDPVNASIWINTLEPNSSIRDEAISNLVDAISSDTEAAKAWASTISNNEKRIETLSEINSKASVEAGKQ